MTTTEQLGLFHVPTGDQPTDDLIDMIRGVRAAMRHPTPRRDGCTLHRIEIAWCYDPDAPLQEQLALALQSGFIAWREAATDHRKARTP